MSGSKTTKKICQPKDNENLEYMADILGELSSIAWKSGFQFVGYLIEMARTEVNQIRSDISEGITPQDPISKWFVD
jgi:hypothetical protein